MCHKTEGFAEDLSAACFSSPLGKIVLQCSATALIRLAFADSCPSNIVDKDASPLLRLCCQWLQAYFAGANPNISAIPIAPQGTPYQQSVWWQMQQIPWGECATYGDICRQLARADLPPGSPRSAGAAAGKNPIAIIIPCHRVVGASGNLTGFAAGLWRKEWLLRHETTHRPPQMPGDK